MFKKTVALLLALALSAGTLAGCGAKGSAGAGAKTGTETGTKAGTKTEARDSLTVILPDDFTTLDPQKLPSTAEICFCANIFDTLVRVDENHQIQPCLAESWEASPDGMSYTFHLRHGVKFHNGEELKADDVVYTVGRFTTEEWMLFCSFMIQDAEAIDDYTVKINLKYPYASFLGELEYMLIANKKYMEEQGEAAAQAPVGTGAYKFVQWDIAQKIVLEANEDYFDGAPPIKNLIFKIITDENTAYVELETGAADLSFNISSVNFAQAEKNEQLATDSCVGSSCFFVNFNTEKLSREVRQALCYAIDKEAINVLVNEGTGVVADLPLFEGQEGYTTDLETYKYDVNKAKQILSDAGIDPASLKLDFFYGESAANAKLGQALQSMFNDIGVDLELRPVETGTWWQLFGDGDYTVSRGGYPMQEANTDAPYYDMYHKDGTFNVSRINDEEINAWLEEARVEQDAARRNDIYVKIAQKIADEAYAYPVYFKSSTIVYNAGLKGVRAVPSQRYYYNQFSW